VRRVSRLGTALTDSEYRDGLDGKIAVVSPYSTMDRGT